MTDFEKYSLLISGLAALFTLFAVIVALYLSLRERKIKLTVITGKYEIYDSIGKDKPPALGIYITNTELRPVIIEAIGWKYGLLKKHIAVQLLDNELFSTKLPIKLNDGDCQRLYIPWTQFSDGIVPAMFRELKKPLPFILRNTLQIIVCTSVGAINKSYNVDIKLLQTFKDYNKNIMKKNTESR